MNAGTMSDGSPVTPQLDARMLADLREWRARVDTNAREAGRWSMRLTLDELDMLLRRVDDLEALRREACAEPETRRAGSTALGIPYDEPMHEPGTHPSRRPEIDEPGCCETCRGSGMVAVGPWGARPPKTTCPDCSGSGWATA